MAERSMLNTVRKIGPVLELFTPERPEWRMTDVANALEMPKSSAHSLLTTLADIGLLSIGADGRYRLGWNLLTLAERMRSSLEFRQHALPAMQELSRELRETVFLAVLDRAEIMYVEKVEGRHPMVRLSGVAIGGRVPAHSSACGKVLLAHRDPNEVRVLAEHRGLRKLTPATISDIDVLEAELQEVRRRGYALDRQEVVRDVACAAAPVRDRHGVVIAAMSVSMPAYRFPEHPDRLVAHIKKTANEISTRIAAAQAERHDALSVEQHDPTAPLAAGPA